MILNLNKKINLRNSIEKKKAEKNILKTNSSIKQKSYSDNSDNEEICNVIENIKINNKNSDIKILSTSKDDSEEVKIK